MNQKVVPMSTRFLNLSLIEPSNADNLTALVAALYDRARELGIQPTQRLTSLYDTLALFFDDVLVLRNHIHLLNSSLSLEQLKPVLSDLIDHLTVITLWVHEADELEPTQYLVQA